jgi:hypothetical protein
MKKWVLSFMMVLFATSAFAVELQYVMVPYRVGAGDEYVEPCAAPNPGPVPANGYCEGGRECPIGYEPAVKTCWRDGWFRECGMVCKNSHMYDGGH